MNVDELDWEDLGIDIKGTFNSYGMPEGWIISGEIKNTLPRWMENEPVLTLNNDGTVYLRGLYSESLTKERYESSSRYDNI